MKIFIWDNINKNNMIYKYKSRLFGLFSVLVIFGVTGVLAMSVNAKTPQKKELEKAIVSSSTCSVTAALYDNNLCSGTGISLTEAGTTVSGWDANKSKFLKITASANSDDGKQHMVEVELPKEFYVVTTKIDEVPVGYSSVNFVKNPDISVMGGTEMYDIQDTSGKLTYVMNSNITSVTVILEIKYDYVLWDKQQGSSITASNVNPIRVTIKHGEENSYLKEVKVSKVLAGDAITGWLWNKIDTEVYDYATTKTKLLDIWTVSDETGDEILYYKDIDIIVDLPYWTDTSGNKYYLTSNQSGIKILEKTHPNVKFTTNIISGMVIIHIDDFYCMTNRDSIYVPMILPGNLPNISEKYAKFVGGNVTIKGTSNNGTSDIVIFNAGIDPIEYQVDESEDIVIRESGNIETYLDKSKDGISFMGGFYLENKGCVDSTSKTITYSFPDKLLATTLKVYCDSATQYIPIEYSLKDEQGNTIYFDSSGNIVSPGTVGATTTYTYKLYNTYYKAGQKNNATLTFSRDRLAYEHSKYYFSSIKYTLTSIIANAKYYIETGLWSCDASGNYYGYLRSDAKKGDVLETRYKVESPSNSGIATLEEEVETLVTDKLITSTLIYLDSLDESNTRVSAGEDITISGYAGGFIYPYGTTLKVKDMNLGVLLPKGIIIDKNNVTLKTTEGLYVEVEKVYVKKSEGDKNFWVIEVDSNIRVGYYDENLLPMDLGWGIRFNITMSTDITMSATNLYTHEMFSFAGKGHDNIGYWSNYTNDDKWDLNEDGRTDSGIAIIPDYDTQIITITGNSLVLGVEDSISVSGEGEVEGNKAIIKSAEDEVTYSINVKRLEVGSIDTYKHFISIPRQNSARDVFLVQGEKESGFDFELSREVTFSGTDMFEAFYTVEEGLGFNDLRDLDSSGSEYDWYSKYEIEADYSWDQVTGVLVTLQEGAYITSDFEANINIHMKSTNKKNHTELGEINKWRSRTFYSFNHSSGTVAGYCMTNGCEAEIAYKPDESTPPDDDVEDRPIKDENSIIKDNGLDKYDDTPDTGDTKNYLYYIGLMFVSVIGVYKCSKKIKYYVKK